MFKGIVLIILMFTLAETVKAEDVRLDCLSLDRTLRVDLDLSEDRGIEGNMIVRDLNTGYFSSTYLTRVHNCFSSEYCFIGRDRFYNFDVAVPKEVFKKIDLKTSLAGLTARHRRTFQYLRYTLSCYVW